MSRRETEATLFVYGALCEPVLARELLGREVARQPATLAGFERGRRRHFFIRPRAGATTRGFVLRGLSARDLAILDQYEDVPRLYTRERAEVTVARGVHLLCWVYQPTGWERE